MDDRPPQGSLIERLQELELRLEAGVSGRAKVTVLIEAATVLRRIGRYADSLERIEQALIQLRTTPDPMLELRARLVKADCFARQNDSRVDAELAALAETFSKGGQNPADQAYYFIIRGHRSQFSGREGDSGTEYERALALYRAANDSWGIAYSTMVIASHYQLVGDIAKATAYLHRALKEPGAQQDPYLRTMILANLGLLERESGRPAQSEALLRQAIEQCARIGDARGGGISMMNLGHTLVVLRREHEALSWYHRSKETMGSTFEVWFAAYQQAGSAEALARMGRIAEAKVAISQGISHAEESKNPDSQAFSHRIAGIVAEADDRWPEAQEHLRTAVEIAKGENNRFRLVAALSDWARLARKRGDLPTAAVRAAEAVGLANALGLPVLATSLKRELH